MSNKKLGWIYLEGETRLLDHLKPTENIVVVVNGNRFFMAFKGMWWELDFLKRYR